MSRRVSSRVKRKSSILDDSAYQTASRRRRVAEPHEGPAPHQEPGVRVEELVERVTNAVLAKLQTQNVNNTTGNGSLSLPATAPAVQGSVVVEAVCNPTHSQNRTENNPGTASSSLEQGTTPAATVQGSITAVLDNLAGKTSAISQPQDIFVSSDIPINMNVSDRLKTKIWSQEYVEFGLLLNNKKEHSSFHLCLSNDTASSTGQPIITLEPNQKSKHINSIDMWITAYQIFVGVYTQKYPLEAPALMKYGDIVQDLAARGYNWRYYDENFRYLRQKEPKAYPWGTVHWELWISSQPPRNIFPPIRKIDESKTGFRVPKGYCWKYHKGQKCVGCNFKHSCPLCEKNHQMMSCHNFRLSKGKPVVANPAALNTSKGKQT